MALGEFNMFSWKSRATKEKEQKEYEIWAFPYGQKQKESLMVLLKELFPKEPIPMCIVSFLTCKELFEESLKYSASSDEAINEVMKEQKRYKHIIKRKDMPTYIALVNADAGIDENCQYPLADEIRAGALEIGSRFTK